ncbi:MAG: aldo/keto reductase [Clostridiales Family XIII bacterium]|nr:aldo/keto reductase [Clostridiales Family XIII bacterium]
MIQRRIIGKLNVEISMLGFGCMRLPEKNGGIDREPAEAMIDCAYTNGINYFDTGWDYHNGESQWFLGDAMKRYPRDSFCLATKMPIWLCKDPSDLDRLFDAQLTRCKTDYFDFYLLHALNANRFALSQSIHAIRWLDRLKKAGKIRFAGFSYHDGPNNLEPILDAYSWDFAQIQHNWLDDAHVESGKLYAILERRGIPAIVMEPVRGGSLAVLPQDVLRILRDARPDRSPAAWALQWAACQRNTMITLSGMSAIEQVKENISIFSGAQCALTEEELKAIDRAAKLLMSYKRVPCTGCRYCMPCPHGVNIPKMFDIYNRLMMFRSKEIAESYFGPYLGETVKTNPRADACRNCGACAPKCPQRIDIPKSLSEVHAAMVST